MPTNRLLITMEEVEEILSEKFEVDFKDVIPYENQTLAFQQTGEINPEDFIYQIDKKI